MGLDRKPIMKLVAGTSNHYIAELPDEVLAEHNLHTRAGLTDPGAADAVEELVEERMAQATAIIQDTVATVTDERIDQKAALEELVEYAEGKTSEGGDE